MNSDNPQEKSDDKISLLLEVAQKADLANILRKLKSGKTLTAAESARLNQVRAPKPESQRGISIPMIAEKTGANQATIAKWLRIEGVKPVRSAGQKRWFDEKEALEALKPHLRPKGEHDTHPNIDPKTGLTWAQKELKEKARKLEMENDRAAKLLSKEIMLTADHHRILGAIMARIEQVPGKISSEQGLSPGQTLALRRALDEAREVAAKEIEEMAA